MCRTRCPRTRDITVHEYLDFYARAYGLRGKKRTQAIEAIEEFTNVTGIRDKHLKALSKGMKQRVSLGRALVYDPDVSGFGRTRRRPRPARARRIARVAHAAGRTQKKAILISSHILTDLTEICNGVVIIERGKILETGTIDDVLEERARRAARWPIRLLESAERLIA